MAGVFLVPLQTCLWGTAIHTPPWAHLTAPSGQVRLSQSPGPSSSQPESGQSTRPSQSWLADTQTPSPPGLLNLFFCDSMVRAELLLLSGHLNQAGAPGQGIVFRSLAPTHQLFRVRSNSIGTWIWTCSIAVCVTRVFSSKAQPELFLVRQLAQHVGGQRRRRRSSPQRHAIALLMSPLRRRGHCFSHPVLASMEVPFRPSGTFKTEASVTKAWLEPSSAHFPTPSARSRHPRPCWMTHQTVPEKCRSIFWMTCLGRGRNARAASSC